MTNSSLGLSSSRGGGGGGRGQLRAEYQGGRLRAGLAKPPINPLQYSIVCFSTALQHSGREGSREQGPRPWLLLLLLTGPFLYSLTPDQGARPQAHGGLELFQGGGDRCKQPAWRGCRPWAGLGGGAACDLMHCW